MISFSSGCSVLSKLGPQPKVDKCLTVVRPGRQVYLRCLDMDTGLGYDKHLTQEDTYVAFEAESFVYAFAWIKKAFEGIFIDAEK